MALAAAAGFGSGSVLVRAGLPGVRMSIGLLVSLASSLGVVAGAALVLQYQSLASITPATVAWFAMTGLLAFAVGRRMDFEGIKRIGAARGASIVAASPLFAIFFAIVLTGETVSLPQLAGVLMIVGGVTLVMSSDPTISHGQSTDVAAGGRSWWGYCFSLTAGLAYGLNNVLIKLGLRDFHYPLVTAAIAIASGTLVLLLLSSSQLRDNTTDRKKGLLVLVFAGVASGIGVACSYLALDAAPVSVVAPVTASFPLWTILGVRLFLMRHESITRRMVVGAISVVLGVSVVAVMRG
jgi:drug/metabolite transporter, DME family